MNIFLKTVAIIALVMAPVSALAAGDGDVKDLKLQLGEPIKDPTSLYGILNRVANWIFAVLMALAIIFVLMAAFTYLTSGGGEEVKKAHKQLLYAAVAVAVAVLAKGIVAAVRLIVETPVSK